MVVQTYILGRMWQELLHNKYVRNKKLSQVEVKPTDSPFWKGLMWVKSDFDLVEAPLK
jgi:hypothetical protein